MRLSFYLDKPNEERSVVMLNVALHGKRIRLGTGISVEPKHWNLERQEPRSSDPLRNAHNNRLRSIAHNVHEIYSKMDVAHTTMSHADAVAALRNKIQHFLTPEDARANTRQSLISDFDEFINTYTIRTTSGLVTTTRPLESTLQKYRLVRASLVTWGEQNNAIVTYDTISLDFLTEYSRWLLTTRNLTDATTSNYVKVLKTFLRWSRQKKYHGNTDYEHFHREKRTGETVALSVDEIRTIRDVDLSDSPRLSRVRDHFLLQCYTGMRYGDLIELEPRHFDDEVGIIRFTTRKTDTPCIIPITKPMQELLARYPSRIFEFASDVKQNVYLKELAARAGLNKEISIAHYRGGRRSEIVKRKHELITTHVARRSFASASVRFGVPESVIAMVTGHSAKGMLQQHYIKLDEEAVRDIVVKAWDQL